MFLISFQNVALLLAMSIPGFLIAKAKMIDTEKASSFLAVMLLYVCQPFITLNSFLNTNFSTSIIKNFIAVFFFTAILLIVLVYIGKLIMSFDKDKEKRSIVAYGGSFGNVGYMCIPFLQILVPGNTEIILYASVGVLAFNLVGWTFGNYILTGSKKFVSIKRAILNPATLSFLLVLPLFVFNLNFIRFPSLSGVANVVSLFNNMVGPLAMTLVGIKFAEMSLKEMFFDFRIYISAGIKLILSPILAFLMIYILSLFMDTSPIRLNLIALSAMPTANNLVMFCSLYGKDTKLATKLVLFSTLVSIITIPFALFLFT